jgi:hypothetical protein
MIIVLGWCDGFGNDTFVLGIFDSIETARKKCEMECNGYETRYQEVELNTIQDFDYYMATPLFKKNKKRG